MSNTIPLIHQDYREKSGFHIRKIASNFVDEEDYHRHSFEELIWIKSGTGVQKIDNNTIELEQNTLYLIAKGQVHNFLRGENLEGFVLSFNSNFLKTFLPFHFFKLSSLVNSLNQINHITLDPSEAHPFHQALEQMQAQFDLPENTYGKYEILNQYLLILFTLGERKVIQNRMLDKALATDYKYEIYLRFNQLLDQSFKQEHRLQFYAKNLGVSSRNLSAYCKSYSGKSAKQLLMERIIAESKRLLSFTSKPLAIISSDLGFEETSYFIRVFRKYTQFTPGEYRAKLIS